jgi:hypothetical protein
MKTKITTILTVFMAHLFTAHAQNLFPATGPAGINATTLDADLRIDNTYNVDMSCNVTGIPALKILRTDFFGSCLAFGGSGGSISPQGPNMIDIQRNAYNLMTNTSQMQPVMMVNGYGNTGLGMNALANTRLSVSGKSNFSSDAYFGNYVQVKNKFRINNTTLVNADWSATNFPYSFSVDQGDSRFLGKVRIGPRAAIGAYAGYKLSVDGDIICTRAVVQTGSWADYVFKPNYQLMPLTTLQNYIDANHHLPNIPAEKEIIENGQDVGTIQRLQQEKIEELTLYILELNRKLIQLELALSHQ